MKTKLLLTAVLLFLCSALDSGARAEGISILPFIVVMNPKAPGSDISVEFLSRAYMGSQSSWSNGDPIKPVHADIRVKSAFVELLQRWSPNATRNFWLQRVFSGQWWGIPELRDEREVLDYCRHTPGAIGYVSKDTHESLQGVSAYFIDKVSR